jgi:hypothetical protein
MQSCRNFVKVTPGRKILSSAEAESKEKHGVLDPMPEFTIASPYVHSRVNSNTFTMGIGQPYARVNLNPVPKSTLSPQSGSLDLPSGSGKFALSRCDTTRIN